MSQSIRLFPKAVFLLCIVLIFSACQKGLKNNHAVFDLREVSIAELQQMMENGEQSAVSITEAYIDRIEKVDYQLNAVLEINPDALSIAKTLDDERAQGKVRSSLHGIPVLLKDNIDTADEMLTTAGSLALVDAPKPKKDAFIVERLREAGAVILGKTNLSEWANFRSTQSSSGWSSRGGQTHNPYVLDRTPCGSSSGSAVAVAANLTVVAIGTETDGSIVCPSSNNNLVGIKPSLGLVSRSGIIPIAFSQDTAGPMARSVEDAVILLEGIVGKDSADSMMDNADIETNYRQFLNPSGLRQKRIGVIKQYQGRNARLDEFLKKQYEQMEALGATLVEVDVEKLREISSDEFEVLLFEFKYGLNQYLRQRGGAISNLQEMIAFNTQNAGTVMPFFGQEIFESAEAKKSLDDEDYISALATSKRLSQSAINSAIEQNNLDALVAPSNSTPWLIDLANGDSPTAYVSSSTLAAVSGYPAITVPAGFIEDFPIGISFIGQNFSEGKLIEIAYAFEKNYPARRPPKYIASFENRSN